MTASIPSDDPQLQELNRAIAANELAQAVSLAFALARRGVLPVMQLIGLAGLMGDAGQAARAAELYHLWLRCTESPMLFAAWYNLGVLQIQADEQQEAEQSLRAALAIKPDFIDARMTLGALQERLRQPAAALVTWRAALARIDPEHPAGRPQQLRALNSVARLAAQCGQYAEAEDAGARSLLLDPRQPAVAAAWVDLRLRQCAWPVCAPLPGLGEADLLNAATPDAMLCLSDDPDLQLAAARRHPVNRALAPAPLADAHGYSHRRLRIGYLSADDGAAALHGLHRRDQFEVYAFNWTAPERGQPRQRVAPQPGSARPEHHISLWDMGDLQAAQTIRAHEIDILVDLHGLAPQGRPGIVAHRPAPVQIAWPGHAGSGAMAAIDHVLADAFVLPPALAAAFTEAALYLPETAQVQLRRADAASDVATGTPASPPTRAACGLPEQGFVFCCFNSGRALAPARFALWMRILQRVPASVLWLMADSEAVRDNLRVAALRHGVASERLVFAARVPQHEHLARYPLADLCLDTLPLSGGANAADALWCGVPLLTQAGRSYAGRLGGGLLHATGLPELVTRSARAYEEKAVRLAGRAQELGRLRRRLAKNRHRAPLFDTPRLVRQLEQLYLRVACGARVGAEDGEGAQDDQGAAAPDVGLPLVSILIPVGHADSADALERTVRGALDQDYGRCEIIVSDSGAGAAADSRQRRLAGLLKAHPRLRFNRAPGLGAQDNLDHCLALALGDFIAVAPAGDALHAEKISRMMQFYQRYPEIGLVACWRQPLDSDGSALPGAPLLPVETAIGGASLAALLLANHGGAGDALCQPAALLLRRAQLGAALGHYQGRRYRHLAGVATVLAMLSERECAYLPAALCSGRPATARIVDADAGVDAAAGVDADADADDEEDAGGNEDRAALPMALERLHLLCEPNTRQHFSGDPGRFKTLLAERLGALAALAGCHHATLAAGEPAPRDAVLQALRDGYALLLAAPPA